MRSSDFIEICGKLYRDNKEAIRMIMTYGKPKLPISSIMNFHKRTGTESYHAEKDTVPVYYSFIPQAWKNIIPTTNKDKSDRYLVFGYLNFGEYEEQKINLSIRIGEFPDPEERSRFVEKVSEAVAADKDCKLTVRSSSKKYMTVFSKSIPLKHGGDDVDLDDYDSVIDSLVQIFNSSEVKKAFEIIGAVVQAFEFKDTGTSI